MFHNPIATSRPFSDVIYLSHFFCTTYSGMLTTLFPRVCSDSIREQAFLCDGHILVSQVAVHTRHFIIMPLDGCQCDFVE